MAKTKSVYVCSQCGADSPKWVGKCPACGAWNPYVEEIVRTEPAARRAAAAISRSDARPQLLRDITAEEEVRIDMHDAELNRVLGGGLVRGSLVLVGGEPGIGKSTLVLQTVLRLTDLHTLYVSGEESARQLKMRADRLSSDGAEGMAHCHVYCETHLEQILAHADRLRPDLMIIDSIQRRPSRRRAASRRSGSVARLSSSSPKRRARRSS